MTLSNRPLLPAGEREDECGPKLIRPWLSKPSRDPETETTAFCRDFWKKKQIIHPALLRGRERCTYPLPKQFPLSLGRPSRGLLLLCLPPVDGGQDGRGGLPTPSSTAPLLEAAADAVREQGWMQGAALGDEQAGRCNRRTGGGSSCPPRQEVLDRLSLLLCSRELLGQVTGCVAEEASLGYRNLEEPTLSASLCQPDTARGGAPGPQVWTSHDPETVP